MGYYSDFCLSIDEDSPEQPTNEEFDYIHFKLEKISNYSFHNDGGDLKLYDAKWYSYHDDMLQLSTAFPNYVFRLEADGEESGDNWRQYYYNGKTVVIKPIVAWPEFSFDMLR